MAQRYPGVYPAMSTPLTEDREIDREGIKKVVGYLFDNGVDGLSILGSTGECSALRREQRKEALSWRWSSAAIVARSSPARPAL